LLRCSHKETKFTEQKNCYGQYKGDRKMNFNTVVDEKRSFLGLELGVGHNNIMAEETMRRITKELGATRAYFIANNPFHPCKVYLFNCRGGWSATEIRDALKKTIILTDGLGEVRTWPEDDETLFAVLRCANWKEYDFEKEKPLRNRITILQHTLLIINGANNENTPESRDRIRDLIAEAMPKMGK
jgi:hypothetical protein